ncbi:MAG: tRNA pseudouridine(38-40) synthase TruA [Planctomycetota bacterium]|nr:tRNA pseudouridine(38-40) synthase TruA [Planctomycetota bacterium]MCX8040118.1 tRNA pseudouridine(38-40) synthase TruA [Planctomycetota bacterium]MDW8373424.1 tRNA pseudouridine(38-40) synthase TruA [Planctomycetota bacterium]
MPRYAVLLEVAGARFCGTQRQRAARTVQGAIERAVSDLDGRPRGVRLASRLDRGVDAEALPAHCDLARHWEPAALCQALNARLPEDLAVWAAAAVAERFHAVRDAVSKTYRYRLRVQRVRPVLDQRCWWLRRLAEPAALDACAALLAGELDLSAFATLRHDPSDAADPVRRIVEARWEHSEREHVLRITGSGFLYRQVRGLVGAMVAVANGRWTVDDFAAACRAGRGGPRLGNIAPAAGLCLERVRYDPEPPWQDAR